MQRFISLLSFLVVVSMIGPAIADNSKFYGMFLSNQVLYIPESGSIPSHTYHATLSIGDDVSRQSFAYYLYLPKGNQSYDYSLTLDNGEVINRSVFISGNTINIVDKIDGIMFEEFIVTFTDDPNVINIKGTLWEGAPSEFHFGISNFQGQSIDFSGMLRRGPICDNTPPGIDVVHTWPGRYIVVVFNKPMSAGVSVSWFCDCPNNSKGFFVDYLTYVRIYPDCPPGTNIRLVFNPDTHDPWFKDACGNSLSDNTTVDVTVR